VVSGKPSGYGSYQAFGRRGLWHNRAGRVKLSAVSRTLARCRAIGELLMTITRGRKGQEQIPTLNDFN